MDWRCDGTTQCEDGTDEEGCSMMDYGIGYNNLIIPTDKLTGKLEVVMSVEVTDIVDIDDVEDSITIKFGWWRSFFDNRLTYKDLKIDDKFNKLTDDEQDSLWKPKVLTPNIARSTDFEYFLARHVHNIVRNPEMPSINADITYNNNVKLFRGSEHYQRIRDDLAITWICDFDMRKYPFDTQVCTMEFFSQDFESVVLVPGNLTFSGSKDLTQYFVHDNWMCTGKLRNGEHGIKIIITLGRPLMGSLLTVFIPTTILIVIGHMSKVFEEEFIDMVIQVNLTGLLVLATL